MPEKNASNTGGGRQIMEPCKSLVDSLERDRYGHAPQERTRNKTRSKEEVADLVNYLVVAFKDATATEIDLRKKGIRS
ncbi:hypothetical protein J6590_027102 [Homalodisca vitripennis]|nr:hypothetical protein J6590_027102 [Homalodisca vitripennis]